MHFPGCHEIWRMVHQAIYTWDHYMHQVEQLGIYYGSQSNKQHTSRVLRPPRYRVLLTIGMSVFMFVRAMIVLHNKQATDTSFKRMLLGTQLFPDKGRRNLETTLLFWAVMHILFVVHGLFQPIVKFSFLSIFVVRPNGLIKPKNLELSQQDYKKLNNWRKKANMLLYLTLVAMAFYVKGVGLTQAYFNGCFRISIVITLSYLFFTMIWTTFICYSWYYFLSHKI